MNTEITLQRMSSMRLNAMKELYYRALNEKNFPKYTLDEFIALMVDTEWEDREHRKIKRLTKNANFKINAHENEIDYTSERNLNKDTFQRLMTLNFIKQTENIIFTGPSGVGKSYLAQTIGNKACKQGIKTLFYYSADLMEQLSMGKVNGNYPKIMAKINKADLLLIDDFALHPFTQEYTAALMTIIEDRYERAATIITSQIPVNKWYQTFGEGTIADAILDRIVYASHRIELKGQSLRKRKVLKG